MKGEKMNRYFFVRLIALVCVSTVLMLYQNKAWEWKALEDANAEKITEVEKYNKEIKQEQARLKQQEDDVASRVYIDGSYEGIGTGFGGEIKVLVSISEDEIMNVEIISANGEDDSYLSMASELLEVIVKKQTLEVDTISGATYSSKGILSATKDALKKAKNKKS